MSRHLPGSTPAAQSPLRPLSPLFARPSRLLRQPGTVLSLVLLTLAAGASGLRSAGTNVPSGSRSLSGPAQPASPQGAEASLRKAIETVSYRLEPAARDTFRAKSPAQRMRFEFQPKSIQIADAHSQPSWRLGLHLASVGRGARVEPVRSVGLKATDNRVEYRHRTESGAELTEWYVNEPRGLEQGFTLERDLLPGRDAAPLQLALSLTGNLTAESAADGQTVTLRSDAGGKVLRCDHLKAWDRTGRELPSRMTTLASAGGSELRLEIDDAAAQYPVTVDPLWAQLFELVSPDGAAEDELGTSVAISGNYAVVGAPGCDQPGLSNVGAAYVYLYSGYSWNLQVKLTDTDAVAGARFGTSVVIDGDTIAVGAPGTNPGDLGAVCVFQRSGTAWNRTARFTQPDSKLGYSLYLRGTRLAAGAPAQNTIGAAYVYEGSGTSWSQTAQVAPESTTADQFGYSVALTVNDFLYVGAPLADDRGADSGAVWTYFKSGDTWMIYRPKILAPDGQAGDHFGSALAGDSLFILVGAENADSLAVDAGAVYQFQLFGAWQLKQKLVPSGLSAGDGFGSALSVYFNTLAIGSANNSGTVGAAYFFYRIGPASVATWTELEKVQAPDGAAGDSLGRSVALGPSHLLAGAPGDDDLGTNSGSLRVFANAPSISFVSDRETVEDVPTESIPLVLADPDTSPGSLVLTANSSVPSLVQSFNFGGSGANRTLVIVPAPNANGTATINLFVTDGISQVSTSFTLTVHAVNDAPTFTPGANQDVHVDSGAWTLPNWATNIIPGPVNEASQTVAFQVTGNTNPSLFVVQPTVSPTGTLTYTPAAGATGTANVKLVLQDNGDTLRGGSNTSVETTLRITVWYDAPPQTLTATPVSESAVDLAWVDAIDHENGFRIERKAPGAASFSFLANVAANAVSYTDSTAWPFSSGAYTYRVFATTPAGSSVASNEAVALTLLRVPTVATALNAPTAEVLFFWHDESLIEVGYEVERKQPGGSFALIDLVPADTEAYLDRSVAPSATYTYRVRAYTANAVSGWSNEASNGTVGAPPSAPSGLSALQAGPNEVRLGWTDNSSDETGFELRRKNGAAGAAGSYAVIAALPAGSTAYIDGGRTPGATYTYQVAALGAGGPSTPAGPASAMLTIDTVKPTLTLTGTRSGPPVQIEITARDTGSGLASIEVLVADNCIISFAPFTPGTTAPVLVTATKVNPSLTARVVLRARDLVGNTLDGDPVITELVVGKKQSKVVKTFEGLPAAETWLKVENDTPGLKKLVVTVNGSKPLSLPLKDGQERTADLASRLQPGDGNTVKLVGHGKPGSRALVIIAEPPAPGTKPAARVLRLGPASRTPVNLEWHR